MPKKTKKEKRRADVRHTFSQPATGSTPVVSAHTVNQITSAVNTYSFKPTAPAWTATPSHSDNLEYRAIKYDLIKTVTLASCAICIELLLYMYIGK